MIRVFGLLRLVLCLGLLGLGGCLAETGDHFDHDESELYEDIDVVSEELSTLSCGMSSATGYTSGKAFSIQVVTVDGKQVEWKTANAYMKMAKAAAAAGVQIRVVSGFRTMAQQQYLYGCYTSCSCNSCNLAAKPGYSNHQSGHALDLNASSSGVYSWLSKHAGSYGFKRTVPSENWHWEWWGTDPGTGPCNDQDKDDDGVVDAKDNCPTTKNASQTDTDKDKKGDACDTDDDGDGVLDTKDNCPTTKNATQTDTDQDGKGDACEADDDGDGFDDTKDLCPQVPDPEQTDTDADGKGDACDDDDDGDGVPDVSDVCPTTADADQSDQDQDGIGDACETDTDGDGVDDADDLCPEIADPDQADTDHDGAGDACDEDDDGDGVIDANDQCPGKPDTDLDACQSPGETEAPPEHEAGGTVEAESGGCSLRGSRNPGSAAWWIALGIAALALRRRRG